MNKKLYNAQDYTDEQLVSMATETVGNGPSQDSLFAQAELLRRLMSSVKNFDRSSSSYSKTLRSLTFVMIVIAMLQLVLVVMGLPLTQCEQIVTAIVLIGIVTFALWYFAPFRVDPA